MNGFLNFRSPRSRSKRFAVSAILLLIAGVFTFFTFAGCEKIPPEIKAVLLNTSI